MSLVAYLAGASRRLSVVEVLSDMVSKIAVVDCDFARCPMC